MRCRSPSDRGPKDRRRARLRASAGRRLRADDGYVTAEAAVVLPVMVGVWLACLMALTVMFAQIRCIDAAREIALAVARGEGQTVVGRITRQMLPPGASVTVRHEGRLVIVTCALQPGAGGGRLRLPAPTATAAALSEEGGPAWP